MSVDYSADGGRNWSTVFVGPDNGRVTLPTRLLSGSRNARLRVRANDGFAETTTISGRFTSAGAPPAVRILTPASAARVSADATLVAQGEAHDDAGRRLAGRRLTWRLGGRIVGRGQELARDGAPGGPPAPAAHRARPRRPDREGLGRGAGARGGAALRRARTRPGSIRRTARRVQVRVVTNVTAVLRVGGRHFRVTSRARTIGVRVRPGRRPVRLRAVLTAGGRRTTATLVIARRR